MKSIISFYIRIFFIEERGVAAFVLVITLPMILFAVLASFQFEQFNRQINRMHQSQSVALYGSIVNPNVKPEDPEFSETMTKRMNLAKAWMLLNTTGISSGFPLEENSATSEDDNTVTVSSSVKFASPLLKIAENAQFASVKKIQVDVGDQKMFGDNYIQMFKKYGKRPIEDLLQETTSEEREKADIDALFNIGAAFFTSDAPLSKTDVNQLAFGGQSVADTDALLFNYIDRDKIVIGTDLSGSTSYTVVKENQDPKKLYSINTNEVQTGLTPYKIGTQVDCRSPQTVLWMQRKTQAPYKSMTDYGTYEKIKVGSNEFWTDGDNNPFNSQTRYFFSDWMLEKTNQQERSLRLDFKYQDGKLVKVFVKISRKIRNSGAPDIWNSNFGGKTGIEVTRAKVKSKFDVTKVRYRLVAP